jgi:hypothetical protein
VRAAGGSDSAGTLLSSAAGARDSVASLLSPGRQRGMAAAGAGGGPGQRGNLAAVRAHEGATDTVYFTAGPFGESHDLFGSLSTVPPGHYQAGHQDPQRRANTAQGCDHPAALRQVRLTNSSTAAASSTAAVT